MNTKLLSASAIALAVIISGGNAQAEPADTNARIAKLEEELNLLKRQLEVKEEVAEAKAKKAPNIEFDKKGLSISSADKNFTLKAKGYAQVDSREFFDESGKDDFLLRRLRPVIEGTAYKDFSFRFIPDFAPSSTTIYDAHIDYKLYDELQFRFGKFKPPVGLERLQSATDMFFIERGHPSNLAPNRDVGLQVYGELIPGTLEYQLGIFDGAIDNANQNTDDDDNKDFAARIFAHPFKGSDTALEGLGLGVGGTFGKHEGNTGNRQLASYRTPGQQNFFSYAGSAFADGEAWRVHPQGYWYYDSFGILGEYALSSQEVTTGGTTEDLLHKAWQVAGSYVITGENATYKGGVKPDENFDPKTGGWGAFEVVARVGQTDIDDDAFPLFASIATSASEATTIGAGLNWYLNENVKLAFDFEDTSFDGGATTGDREDEKVLFSRVQFRL